MSLFLFIGSIIWGGLAAAFLVQAISSFISACIFLYGLLFSRVKKKLNAIFFSSALTQAAVFAVLLVGWVGLLVGYGNVNWTAGSVAFVVSFIYWAIQVPNKILAARMCAMKPLFAEMARSVGIKAALGKASPPLTASPRPGLLNSSRTTTSCVTLTVSNSRTFIIRMFQSGDQRPSYSAKMRPEGLLLISPNCRTSCKSN
jgi:hypothetical protein